MELMYSGTHCFMLWINHTRRNGSLEERARLLIPEAFRMLTPAGNILVSFSSKLLQAVVENYYVSWSVLLAW